MLFLFLIYFILNANDMICRKSQLLNILTTLMHSNLSKIIWHWCNLHLISENILIILHKLEELFCKSICNTSKFKTRQKHKNKKLKMTLGNRHTFKQVGHAKQSLNDFDNIYIHFLFKKKMLKVVLNKQKSSLNVFLQ